MKEPVFVTGKESIDEIIEKIISQDDLKDKLSVYLMFSTTFSIGGKDMFPINAKLQLNHPELWKEINKVYPGQEIHKSFYLRFAMNYGSILGLILVAIAVIMWSVGADDKQSVIPALLNNGITIAFIAYAIIQYRDINNNGFISYAESLKLGTTVAFFSSIILAFYQFIYISYLDPNALSEIMKITEQAMLESNPEISDEELDMALQMTSKFMQPHWMMIMGMLGGTFMGFLYSLIISIFVKKEDPTLIA